MSDFSRLYRYFCEQSPQPIATVEGAAHVICHLNPVFSHLAGKKITDLIGRPFADAVPPAHGNEYLPLLDRVRRTGKPGSLVEQKENRAPLSCWSYEAWPVAGTEKCPSRIMVMVTDVTDAENFRRQSTAMNEALLLSSVRHQELAEQLALFVRDDREGMVKLVSERSAELATLQMELGHARRLSDIGTLAATVAHELRSPLAAIKAAVFNLKRKTNEGALLERHLHTIEKKVDESGQIINNLLFYSRLRPPRREDIDLLSIVDECADAAVVQSRKDVMIEKAPGPARDMFLEADPLQMKEVFSNLINNALDAIPAAQGKIEIRDRQGPNFVELSVKDNGAGIAKENLGSVFLPFFTTKARGTGLGLTVCHQIIKMHGGSISIESVEGRGTTFTVRLPRQERRKQLREN
jgi:signal transduction histidine kinase